MMIFLMILLDAAAMGFGVVLVRGAFIGGGNGVVGLGVMLIMASLIWGVVLAKCVTVTIQ